VHEAGYGIDISWKSIPVSRRQEVVDRAAGYGIKWGGDFRKPDPVHFYVEPAGGRKGRKEAIKKAQKRYKDVFAPCP
jgi:hypothetical protein